MQKQMMFWLNSNNPAHNDVWELSETLKAQRKFNPSVINGLRLIHDLNEGRTEVLLELYPWLSQALAPSDSPSGNGDLEKVLREFQEFKQLVTAGLVFPESPNGLAMKKLEGATKDTSEPVIELKKDTSGGKAAWNLLIASAAMMNDYSQLAPLVLAYGIESGKIPAHHAKPKPVHPAAIEAVSGGDGNAKIMQVPQFAAPVFDDD